MDADQSWRELEDALSRSQAAFVLGAGVSSASGIPLWGGLVKSLIEAAPLSASERKSLLDLRRDGMPDQTVMSLLRMKCYPAGDARWKKAVRDALYTPFEDQLEGDDFDRLRRCEFEKRADPDVAKRFANRNPTLSSVVDACVNPTADGWEPCRHVRAVLTYNLDGLVQMYDRCRHGTPRVFRTVERASKRLKVHRKIPLYHLHGYLLPKEWYGGEMEEVVLTEEEYHTRTDASFNFANTTMLAHLQACTCIFVGCSMSDELMRRALFRSRSELEAALEENLRDRKRRHGEESRILRHFAVVERKSGEGGLDNRETWMRKSLKLLGVNPLWVQPDYSDLRKRLLKLRPLLS